MGSRSKVHRPPGSYAAKRLPALPRARAEARGQAPLPEEPVESEFGEEEEEVEQEEREEEAGEKRRSMGEGIPVSHSLCVTEKPSAWPPL